MTHSPALTLLLRLWLGVAIGLAVITTLVLVAATAEPTLPAILPLSLVAAAGVGAVIGARAVDRLFAASPPRDDAAALAELRQRAYLAVGIAEAPVLLGVAVAFVIGPRWAAVVGAIAGLAVLVVARPTVPRITRIESAWQDAGHDVSILRALHSDAEHGDGAHGT